VCTGVGVGADDGGVVEPPGVGEPLGEVLGEPLGPGGVFDVAGQVPVSSKVVASSPVVAETVPVALTSTAPAGSPTNACLSVGGPNGPVLVTLLVTVPVMNVTVIETKDVLSCRSTKWNPSSLDGTPEHVSGGPKLVAVMPALAWCTLRLAVPVMVGAAEPIVPAATARPPPTTITPIACAIRRRPKLTVNTL
jgi:hypothetical protein